MPKISQERRDHRRMQILGLRGKCFYRAGLHETTMHDIIRESGLSTGVNENGEVYRSEQFAACPPS